MQKNKLLPYLLIPDTHVPYHDKRAWKLMLASVKNLKLHGIIILGDFCDFYAVSSHSKNPNRARDLEWEIDRVNEKLDDLAKLGAKDLVYIGGNHEDRLLRYLQDRAPELYNIISIPSLLKLEQRGFKYVPYKETYKKGKINYTHDVGSAGRYSVYRCLETYAESNVTGHTHRSAMIVEGDANGKYKISVQLGWLGDVEQVDYMHKAKARKDWSPGFGIEYYNPTSGFGYITPVPLVHYTTCINGILTKG
jgi:UDP-2,3-diacylglucosamine pyrophosphatase LpxH